MNESLDGELAPWDRGRLLAHQIAAGSTDGIEDNLERARRQRRGFFALVSRKTRRYLDGLISGLETALDQRHRDHRYGRKRRSTK